MVTPKPTRPKPLEWKGPSQLAIFVRNLKLLNLEQRNDWPGVTLRALSPSSQNQRQRIRLIEWSLYQIFAIWDPEVAQNKLRPFFPPLEHLQSVNLRAALFRALTELKKNGDLGRETILRKTMLDDCRGEKFDEVLAVFSSAVLRKVLAASSTEIIWNPVMVLSTAPAITPADYQNLVPLIIAHQFSLERTGTRRTRAEETVQQFSRLLDDKRVELEERSERTRKHNSRGQELSEADTEALAHELQSNWLGAKEWATTIQEGGSQSNVDALLKLPFPQALKCVSEPSWQKSSESHEADLMRDLENRVSQLRGRLRKWNEFSESLRHKRPDIKGLATSPVKEPRECFRCHQSLNVASISKTVRESATREREMNEAARSFLTRVNAAITEEEGKPVVDKGPDVMMKDSTQVNNHSITPTVPSIALSEHHSGSPSPESPPPFTSSPPTADLPMKASEDNLQSEDDDEPNLPTHQPQPRSTPFNLVERTRKSMSLIPPLPAQETQPSSKRRGPRPSFPVNQFETPRKSSRPEISRSSTPKDKLFEEDADYASVFKSRPRIALSPISSPAVHVSPSMMVDESFTLEYDDSELGGGDSPLVSSRFRN
ncbi:Uncharacterized protein PECH_004577 [Penicillium ucsense]|uniref:HAUS augmin-like complex subunit 6 N-terminal domain-containing protein n=1 Tax=Penicillium ucsense TaxID=2839758 RepID=A0A8J8W2D3_9EURO|nr:Uncharacterized protein PECM_006202 [Penicillium ucsense]KAF7736923.1 Uncharacterized protein PECH_004577 [Penicillium ucsense]